MSKTDSHRAVAVDQLQDQIAKARDRVLVLFKTNIYHAIEAYGRQRPWWRLWRTASQLEKIEIANEIGSPLTPPNFYASYYSECAGCHQGYAQRMATLDRIEALTRTGTGDVMLSATDARFLETLQINLTDDWR